MSLADTPLLQRREPRVQLARDLHTERQVLEQYPLVRRVDVRLGECDTAQDRWDALIRERRDDRQRAAAAGKQRPAAHHVLERLERDLYRRLIPRDEPLRSEGFQ